MVDLVKKESVGTLVSIIIPVYNNEAYLEACIFSVVHQTYKNIEVIVVNDGSTDNSLSVINNCSDSRIIVIDKSNEGTFLARKAGLDKATGKYVQYLDSDDTLIEDAIERLVTKAEETNADIIAAPFFFCHMGKGPELSAKLRFKELSGSEYFREMLTGNAYWSVWSNFQKRSLSIDFPIRVISNMSYAEDTILITQLVLNANKVVALSEPILNYNKYMTSMTAQMTDWKYKQLRFSQIWIENYLEEKGLKFKFSKELAIRHIQMAFSGIYWHLFQNTTQDMKRMIKDLSLYPDLCSLLNKQELKIVSYYRKSALIGRIKLICYSKKGKI